MTHYRLLDREPSAIITVNGSEKKVYNNGQIFLNDGDNFEIRFFNPLQEKIGVEIIFNGKKRTTSLLVLNPGQDVTLDRFLDEKKKMKFETYTIDGDNPDAVKAIMLNGLIEIKFYKTINYIITTGYCIYKINYTLYPQYTSQTDYTITNNYYTSNNSCTNNYFANRLETGRIEKGEESNQDFIYVNEAFESVPFHTITYQLKPISQKPVEIKEIRNYCSSCGYRIRKSSWKYCPKCGHNLNG